MYIQAISDNEIFILKEFDDINGFGWIVRNTPEIRALYIRSGSQGHSYGTKLLMHLEKELLHENSIKVCASLNARGFYLKHGYKQDQEDLHKISGLKIPVVHMEKYCRGG
jgi:GNAT superfamily N-acetyltransferase